MGMENLRATMRSKNISANAIAAVIGTTEKTVNNKLNGISDFSAPEAIRIYKSLFSEYDFMYLFMPDTSGADPEEGKTA